MSKPKPTYFKSPGFRISQRDATIIGPAFEKLERRLRRPPTPADLVADAEDPGSPFHPYLFALDDVEAAYEYRLLRARYIIMAVDVTLPDRGDIRVRGIVPVSFRDENDDEAGGFMSTAKAARDRPDVIALQVKRAKDDARQIVARYEAWIAFKEFGPHGSPARSFLDAAKAFAAS